MIQQVQRRGQPVVSQISDEQNIINNAYEMMPFVFPFADFVFTAAGEIINSVSLKKDYFMCITEFLIVANAGNFDTSIQIERDRSDTALFNTNTDIQSLFRIFEYDSTNKLYQMVYRPSTPLIIRKEETITAKLTNNTATVVTHKLVFSGARFRNGQQLNTILNYNASGAAISRI